ncbi:hypothetical protein GeomeDRAFT_0234 [Geobacter metallireducens RCH3]|uniref:Lipoprotein, putative n=1 Tax=Geobacter metallireducens (strain ATCC 53774 / DSM 7210 / GS-15) TaxID=269799 RepID=Q39VN5_GEOMG|nr:hypothetical protein [Geobacter metallireducens]ABB31689.1 lipoprotein, putative [Geobacter metallireducens GS-15]EHP89436.1 hypothetical protein GeomeDRAFT_0234 [Geobacter metallireducens RCH3]
MYRYARKYAFTVVAVGLVAGCAAPERGGLIKAGDPVRVTYTCFDGTGALAATNVREAAGNNGVKKGPLFLPSRDYSPLQLTAGTRPEAKDRGVDDELAAGLAGAVVGKGVGEVASVELAGGPLEGLSGGDRYLKMATVRKRAKELRLGREEYLTRTGREPEKGRRFVLDPALPGIVEEVTDKEVVIRFPLPDGGVVQTPFGPGTVRDGGDQWEIVIDAAVGRIVRSGPLAGRISDVNERFFTIDYGYPFGGESLRCDVKAERSEQVGKR